VSPIRQRVAAQRVRPAFKEPAHYRASLSAGNAVIQPGSGLQEGIDPLRCALSLILGRRADVILPVGWKGNQPAGVGAVDC
jgi:hypothetical protein